MRPDPSDSITPDLADHSQGKSLPAPSGDAGTIVRRDPVVTAQTDWSRIHPSVFIAPGATVLGEVHIGAGVGIWFGAAMRGDTERIEIGEGSNVQEQCVLHGDPGFPCIIGRHVTIGHGAIVHGATVEDDALIGIGAIVLNGARIGRGAVIAAGALVPEGKEIPPGMLVVGTPGKVVKPVPEELAERTREGNRHYIELAARYRQAMSESQ